MNFNLSEEHEALRDSASSFLSKEVDLSPLLVPGSTVAAASYDALWAKIVAMGWPGMVIPEAYGGLGMDNIDLVMIVGEMGRTLAPAPLFGTLAGAWAILAAGDEAQKARLLGGVAAGEMKLAVAVADEQANVDLSGTIVDARADGDHYVLNGVRSFVVDADAADRIVVPARLDGALRWFVVERSAVQVELLPWKDITRQVARVRFDGASAELLLGQQPESVWPFVRDRLYLMLAAESTSGSEAALRDAVDYAQERVAFGRPIGGYQAIKHQLAEIAGLVECAKVGVLYAAWALSSNDADATLAAAMAQSYASEAYRAATYRNIQVFGAIGFTWEMKNHLFYKRARCNAELLGAPRQQREEIMTILERKAA
ncbi:MAG: acyl-CoA dehydrogenase family protein [Sphingobium sp.]